MVFGVFAAGETGSAAAVAAVAAIDPGRPAAAFSSVGSGRDAVRPSGAGSGWRGASRVDLGCGSGSVGRPAADAVGGAAFAVVGGRSTGSATAALSDWTMSAGGAAGCWVLLAGPLGCSATGSALAVTPGFGAVCLTAWLGVVAAAGFSVAAFSAAGEPLASGSIADVVGRSGAAVPLAVSCAAVFLDVVGFFAIARNLRGLLASNVLAGRLPSHWAAGRWIVDQRAGGLSMPG